MAPRLRVLAGTSPETMVPITSLVNTSSSYTLSSPLFEGKVNVQIKGMTDEKGRVRDSKYFNREDKVGITWSIQVQGRFLVPQSADDILFGNTFDRPLKLPWGTSAVLKFMHYIDPTLEHDLASSSKPWALSPMISTMPHFMHTRLTPKSASSCKPSLTKAPSFPSLHSVKDDTNQLYVALVDLDEGGLPLHPPSISSSTSSFAPSSFAPSSSPASTSLSSTSPRTSPDLRLSIPHRSPSSLSSHSAGSSASSASFASALSLVSSSSSSSSSGSVPSAPGSSGSKLSGGGSIHIKQAMRKVHLRKRSASRGRSDREEEEEDGEQRRKAMRKEREKELRKLDSSSAAQRRAHFASRAKRRDIWFGPM
ncbi:hypothetical protein BDZ97DRAFT_1917380 [Flammula alnicola]|nr:hypothetical protein BDZ97DRAFT_1917380 [Flammula alnicola]